MPQPKKQLTDLEKKAVADFLSRPTLRFEPAYYEQQRRLKEEEKRRSLEYAEPGAMIEGQGIFLGKYAPKDRSGQSLGKIFNVFAAPQDLPKTMKYVDAVKHIAKLKGWNGFDGTDYATDKEIYKALKDGSYNGGWIIPTRDLLSGKDVDGNTTQPDNLYVHKDKGALAGTFCMAAAGDGSDCPGWYWSSTEHRDNSSYVLIVRFSDGIESWYHKDVFRLSCRPVRLVAAPSLG